MTAVVTSPGAGNVDVEDMALDLVRDRLAGLGRQYTPVDVATAMRAEGMVVSDSAVLDTVESLRRHSVGAGPLEQLLHQPGVTDVLVNGADQVFVDRGAGLELTGVRFRCEGDVRRLAQRLAASVGRRLDDAMPFVDARLADGSRVHAVLGTLASPGTCISLRVPAHRSFSLQDCVASGSVTPGAAQLLSRMIEAKLAFLISGGTGSGKTTLLAALLALVPPEERIVIVEDSRELAPHHPHVVRIEGRPANTELAGAITLTDLVRQSLRMRPDRLVIGEVRGAEICDLLTAMNTGHEGGCGTVHANSTADIPARLEALASLGGLPRSALHAQLASALDAVVHVARDDSGMRRVAEISIFVREPGSGLVHSECAVHFRPDGGTALGAGSRELERMLDRSS
ncbi:MAG: TadA family conjugal transfer-associated ATPase [Propionibacteriaceae bacterium]|jgi:pilus assembly protein CpaF|nr:TadA family conjugal transfer-associated ATPase [Propionibacteriaceae bacterium]